jgi:DNA repair protein RadA/Sms
MPKKHVEDRRDQEQDNLPGDKQVLVITRRKGKTPALDGARLLLRGNGGITEVRVIVPGRGVILGGYFNRTRALVRALANCADRLDDANVYATLNPVKPDLLERAPNRLRRLKTLTKDRDILNRRWFPIDVDPVRPAGVSSTRAELQAARCKRDELVAHLRLLGWGDPVVAISGNGAHALYRLDLPNTPEVTALIGRALKALDAQFSDDVAKVDTTVGNPSRVWKVYGTVARKGRSTKARPHRRSYIEIMPRHLRIVSHERLHRLAQEAAVTTGPLRQAEWSILAAVKARGLFRSTKAPGQHAIECPWSDQHTIDGGPTDAMLFEPSPANGNRGGYKCQHSHCDKRTIDDVIALVAPDAVQLLCMSEISPEEVRWLWFPRIPLDKLTLLEGDPGLGKSHLALQLATAVSLGYGLPGMLKTTPANTVLLTAEDGLGDTVRPRLDAMKADVSRIFQLDGPLVFDAAGLGQLEQAIQETSARLVVVDPLVAYLGATIDLHRANETRAITKQLAAMAARHHCAMVLVRHLTKSGKDRAIYRGLGSIDLTASCRSAMLVGSDPNDPTRAALVHIKSNLAAKAASLGFTIADGIFKWTGRTMLTAADILGAEQGGQSAVQEAEAFLRSVLADGPVAVAAVQKQARVAGVAEKTLRRARESLGVIPTQVHEEGRKGAAGWTWCLPDSELPSAPAEGQVNDPALSSVLADGHGVHLPLPPGEPGEGQVKDPQKHSEEERETSCTSDHLPVSLQGQVQGGLGDGEDRRQPEAAPPVRDESNSGAADDTKQKR